MPRIFACFLLVVLLVACSHNPKGSAKNNTNNKTATNTSTTKKARSSSSKTANSKNTSVKTVTSTNNTGGNSNTKNSTNPITDNTKQIKKLPKKIADFPVNQIATYYKVPFTVLKIEKAQADGAKDSKEFDISKTEDQKAFLIHTITPEELEKDPEKYIENLQVKYQRKSYVNVKLSQDHKTILQKLLSKTDKNSNKLALMFVNGYKLKTYEQQTISVEKTVYAQYITDYLYNLDSKIRVEKRYVTDMPDDEIFIIIVGFEGRVPYNVYNAPKLDSIQWLSRYVDYEYKKNQETRKENADLEQVIENTASAPEEINQVTPDELAEYQEQQTNTKESSTTQNQQVSTESTKVNTNSDETLGNTSETNTSTSSVSNDSKAVSNSNTVNNVTPATTTTSSSGSSTITTNTGSNNSTTSTNNQASATLSTNTANATTSNSNGNVNTSNNSNLTSSNSASSTNNTVNMPSNSATNNSNN